MPKIPVTAAESPITFLGRAWQPLLSISAISLSLVSYWEAHRANTLAEQQFQTEQARQKALDAKAKLEARSVVVTEVSADARELSFSIPDSDVRLRQVILTFPSELGTAPVWTDSGRPQKLSISEFEQSLRRIVLPPGHGPIVSNNVTAFIPLILTANLVGRGEAYSEMSTYTLQIRSRLVGDEPRITIESFDMDDPIVGGLSTDKQMQLLSKCWKDYAPGMERHDLNHRLGYGFCPSPK